MDVSEWNTFVSGKNTKVTAATGMKSVHELFADRYRFAMDLGKDSACWSDLDTSPGDGRRVKFDPYMLKILGHHLWDKGGSLEDTEVIGDKLRLKADSQHKIMLVGCIAGAAEKVRNADPGDMVVVRVPFSRLDVFLLLIQFLKEESIVSEKWVVPGHFFEAAFMVEDGTTGRTLAAPKKAEKQEAVVPPPVNESVAVAPTVIVETPYPTIMDHLKKKVLDHYISVATKEIDEQLLEGIAVVRIPAKHHAILYLFIAHWKEQGLVCALSSPDGVRCPTGKDVSYPVTIRWPLDM